MVNSDTNTVRNRVQRKQDVFEKLEHDRDVWVATADGEGGAHLVPLALAWDGKRVIFATEDDFQTAQNIRRSHQARLALGSTRDVVLIDARVETVPASKVEPEVAELFADRNKWDPRKEKADWVYLLATPVRVQAWQNLAEMRGRTLMRDGRWLI